jgi:hypothetical protein
MTHLLVVQLRFARSEFQRAFAGVSEVDARRRVGPMNSLSWIVGHLANQEQRYWLQSAQGITPFPELNALVGTGMPASTPPLGEMWEAWRQITQASDAYLASLPATALHEHPSFDGKPSPYDVATLILRNIYHYFFHTGEALGARQAMGHMSLPEFVGNMSETGYFLGEA